MSPSSQVAASARPRPRSRPRRHAPLRAAAIELPEIPIVADDDVPVGPSVFDETVLLEYLPPPPGPTVFAPASFAASAEFVRAQRTATAGFGVAALVVGIVGTVLGLVPLFFPFALAAGVIGLVFALVGVANNRAGRGLAFAGFLLAVLAVGLGVAGMSIVDDTIDDIDAALDDADDGLSAPQPAGVGVIEPDVGAPPVTPAVAPGAAASTTVPVSPAPTTTVDPAPVAAAPAPQAPVVLKDPTVEGTACGRDESGFATYSGALTNNATETLSFEVFVEFFDQAGVRMGEGFDWLEAVAPGTTAAWTGTDLTQGIGSFTCKAHVEGTRV